MGEANPIPTSVKLSRALRLLPAAHHHLSAATLHDRLRLAYPSPVNHLRVLDQEESTRIVAHRRHLYLREIISSIWRTPPALTLPPQQPLIGSKSIPQTSSAPSVRSASHVHTICDLIYGHILTSDLSSARSVEKHLRANMIARDTRGCIAVRRSSSAKANLDLEGSGVVGDGLRELMPWEDTSDPKPEESASSHYLMKKQSKERRTG